MILLSIIALTIFALAVVAAYASGFARGLKHGIIGQNVLYKNAYEQVLQISTEETKRRLNDQVEAQERMCAAIRKTNDESLATAAALKAGNGQAQA